VLERVPSLADSYGRVLGAASRAMLLRRTPGAGGLPDLAYAAHGVRADRERLTAYQHLVGEPATDELPAGYVHVLAFPLAVALMVRADFPLPVLGLVHLANRVEQARELKVDEPLTVRAWARALGEHRRGTQVEIVTEVDPLGPRVEGPGDGPPPWCGVATYLAKGVRLGAGPEAAGPGSAEREAVAEAEPPRERATARWDLAADVGRRYGAVSGDRNPLHLSAATARPFGFRRAVAHGMYLAARALAGVGHARGPAFTWDITFGAPVLLPGRVDVRLAPAEDEPPGGSTTGWVYSGWHPRTGQRHFHGAVVPASSTEVPTRRRAAAPRPGGTMSGRESAATRRSFDRMRDPLADDVPSASAAQPDALDWAASLANACPTCGFSAADLTTAQIAPAIRSVVPRWQAVLARPDVRRRPGLGVWSPLEYACHVRDLITVVAARVDLVLAADEPLHEDWDENLAALDGDYATQDPAEVAADLAAAAGTLAQRLDDVHGTDWERAARRAAGGRVSVREMGLYLVHDMAHHLQNVGG
jgi:acyl dehydratase